MTEQELIDFETEVKNLWEQGELPCLLHLSGGNEKDLLPAFEAFHKQGGGWIFSTHRNHYHALLSGIPKETILEKIKAGRHMFIYSKEHNFFCSAILAGCCGIAAGVAYAMKLSGEPGNVICFIGDGGEEQGHFYEAAMFSAANELPILFAIEDNDRSVDTPLAARRGKALGLENLFPCVTRYKYKPTYPHAGSGCKFQIKFKDKAIERMKPK